MTPEEEYKMIAKECEWAVKYELEKRGELDIAQRRHNEAVFKKKVMLQAMADFLAGNPEFNRAEADAS